MANYKLFYKGVLTAKQHAQILQLILNIGPGAYKIAKNEKGEIRVWQQRTYKLVKNEKGGVKLWQQS